MTAVATTTTTTTAAAATTTDSNGVNGSAHEPSPLEAATSDVENQLHDASSTQEQIEPDDIMAKADEETIPTFQDSLTINNEPSNLWILSDDDHVPFPSVKESTEQMDELVKVCPRRCLFFTLKETVSMVMSALGCAVFVAGLVFLIMFLEGSWFEQ
jgi:hypothetical protein